MDEFYKNIVSLTEETAEKSVLTKHTNELFAILTNGYTENIRIAASHGHSTAYLSLFNVHSVYRGNALIIDLLFPPEKVVKKCVKYGITPVFDRIKEMLVPFEVEYAILNADDDEKSHIACICAKWKIPQSED